MLTVKQSADLEPNASAKDSPMSESERYAALGASILINLLSVTIPITALLVYDRVLPTGVVPTLGVLIFGAVVIVCLDTILRISRTTILTRAAARYEHLHRDAIMQDLLSRPFPPAMGLNLNRLTSVLSSVSSIREHAFLRTQAVVDLPFGGLFLLIIAVVGGWLVLIPLSACAVMYFVALNLARMNSTASQHLQKEEGHRQDFVGQIFNKVHPVKAIAAEIPIIDGFLQKQVQRSNALRKQTFVSTLIRDSYSTFSQILIGSVVITGAVAVLNEQLTLGGLAACTLLTGRALEPLQTLFQLLILRPQIEVLKSEAEILIPSATVREDLKSSSSAQLWDNAPAIEITNLNTRAGATLKNINLSVAAGEIIAISSDRGGGKTTLARAMVGAIPWEGEIVMGDITLTPQTVDTLRQNITFLSREPDLPSGRLIDAITDGDESSYADARYLSHMMGLDEAIKRLPYGYDTVIGRETMTLPSGIRQQLAIVRGLARKTKIIIVDDVTFSLDASSEMRLAQLIKMLRGEATIILLTDRPILRSLANHKFHLASGSLSAEPQKGD